MTDDECTLAEALAYVRDVTGMDPATPAREVLRFCIIDTAASYEVLAIMRAQRERDGATAH